MGRPRLPLTAEQESEILKKYQDGVAKNAICKEYGFSSTVVDRLLKEAGIKRRDVHEANTVKIPPENEIVVLDNYLKKKMGLQTAGAEFGYPQSTVESILKRNHVKKREYVEAKQLLRRYSCDDDFFKNQCPDMAYVLGFIAADGNISKKENGVFINLAAMDGEILERMAISMKLTRPISYYTKKQTGQELCKLSVFSHEWKHDLAKYGITSAKTFTLQPPLLLSKKYYADYIRGYFDADGSVFARHNKKFHDRAGVKIAGASKVMMEWIRDTLANQYNVYTPTFRVQYVSDGKTAMYEYGLSNKAMTQRFYDVIYGNHPNLYLMRKFEKFTSLLEETPRDSGPKVLG